MAIPRSLRTNTKDSTNQKPLDRHWRVRFLDTLAISSNVTHSAAAAGISLSRAYRLRRAEPEFARQWQAALDDGYLHLELELVRRLRDGDFKTDDGQKFDFSNAIRLLAAHRGTASGEQSGERDVSAAEVRASINRKIEEIRQRMAKTKPDGSPA